jgi:chromate reductase
MMSARNPLLMDSDDAFAVKCGRQAAGMLSPLTVLALSGSLRRASLNTAMLTMASRCAPPGMSVTIFAGMGDLPLFNPDLESREPPQVARLRTGIADADALLIAGPEYAHGVSGVMKNALDWMVASGVLMGKPVALWNASPRASHAIAALRETLAVMAARLVDAAGLELLIGHDSVGRPLPNPDEAAMRRALLAIKADLCQQGRSSSS